MKPYSLLDVDAKYVSGPIEDGPYRAARRVLKALEQDDPKGGTEIIVIVSYVPASDVEDYWSATAVRTT